ncbi:hypothetical protein CPB86DRAFT_808456 [Serendipita vermifera]|nr:hypothetical protein CPB86DRAFT_808456 [Serendipita vermifera]
MAARQRTLDLMARKDALETELSTQFSILSANQSTMNTPLVDREGFPRADIDIWAVRHARVRIIELRNDLKQVVDDIAVALAQVSSDDAAGIRTNGAGPTMVNGTSHNEADSPEDLPGFARVDGVAPGSPAAVAGLIREDVVIRFGRLTAADFRQAPRSLQPLAALVAEHENQSLDVVVRRAGDLKTLNFTPRNGWGGRGLLGCHIVPIL